MVLPPLEAANDVDIDVKDIPENKAEYGHIENNAWEQDVINIMEANAKSKANPKYFFAFIVI